MAGLDHSPITYSSLIFGISLLAVIIFWQSSHDVTKSPTIPSRVMNFATECNAAQIHHSKRDEHMDDNV